MAHYEDIRTSTVAIIGVIGALVIFILVILLMVLYQGALDHQNAVKDLDHPYVERDSLAAEQESALGEYKWLKEIEEDGKKRDVYAIPIDRAMELVVAELSSGDDRAVEDRPVRQAGQKPDGTKQGPDGGAEKAGAEEKGGQDDAKS